MVCFHQHPLHRPPGHSACVPTEMDGSGGCIIPCRPPGKGEPPRSNSPVISPVTPRTFSSQAEAIATDSVQLAELRSSRKTTKGSLSSQGHLRAPDSHPQTAGSSPLLPRDQHFSEAEQDLVTPTYRSICYPCSLFPQGAEKPCTPTQPWALPSRPPFFSLSQLSVLFSS